MKGDDMSVCGYIIVTYVFSKEADQWVGTCRELGTSVCADTFEDAEEHLCEAVELHLNALEDVGERKRFLKEHRIRFHRAKPQLRGLRTTVPPEALVKKQSVPICATA